LLCYRCGTHAPDIAEVCPTCGQKLSTSGLRQATGTFSRRRAASSIIEGAPFKAQDLVASRYLVKDAVGVGPLGFVFRAHDKEIDVEVALKVINPKLVQTPEERNHFAKVLRGARKLSHPNLVRVYEEGEDGDKPFFTSQYLDGLTLRRIIDLRLQKGQFFALHEIEPILSQVCSALEGAHKVGPHSDLKPDNVLVLPDLLKVTDFGLGLAIPRLPFVQAMRGRKSDRYLSPEFIEGGEVDGRADIYSVGVILGEMVSGLTPEAGAVPELSKRNPEVSHALEGLYRKAVNSNPLARHKTPAEFLSDLSAIAKKSTPPPMPSRPEAMAPVRPRTSTGMMAIQPRLERAPEPPPQVPPPPPPISSESLMPDATQPVDPEKLGAALAAIEAGLPLPLDGEGQLEKVPAPDDEAATKATIPLTFAPPPVPRSPSNLNTWLLVGGLVVLGVGLGAAGGFWALKRNQQAPVPAAGTGGAGTVTIDPGEIERLAEERLAAARLAAEQAKLDAGAADGSTDDTLAADKAADKAAADKVAADKVAADKAAADKAAADKAAADKAAAAAAVPKKDGLASAPKGACAEGMRLVAAGVFRMGTGADDPMFGFEDKTVSSVKVNAFCVDAFEYPNKKGAAPMTGVNFGDAERLCQAQGKRLCAESEWEKACKGGASSKWTFGNEFDANACNTEDDSGEARSLATSGRFGRCRSGYGVFDMSGNVAEWTAERVVKGGSFATSDYGVRCAARKSGVSKSSEVGFRCCSEAP
jgi:eukaryotic-like serine/threonine-protein kinase